jgi:hypothetical protein
MIRAASAGFAAALALAAVAAAQPQGLTPDMINRQLPEEGAPLAVPGPYAVVSEAAGPRNTVFRPADLSAFPATDTLPVVLWGNGGCAANPGRFSGFLETIASHGFLVVTTAAPADAAPPAAGGPPGPRATAEDLIAGLDWAIAENARESSPLQGKVDVENAAAMGVSCGGIMALGNAGDARLDTIGVFNSGVQPPRDGAPAGPFNDMEALAKLHGPTLYLNGGEPDFATPWSKANYEAINTVPIFYGERANAGHSATYYHKGGGEFANVAVAWAKWHLKGDEASSAMFLGDACGLCSAEGWTVERKGWE